MHLFINTISEHSCVLVFDDKRFIISKYFWKSHRKEFETLGDVITHTLQKSNIKYTDLKSIILLHGPGGFTGTRISALVANCIGFFMDDISCYELNFFEFAHLSEVHFPVCLICNAREYLLENNFPKLTKKWNIPKGDYFSNTNDVFWGVTLTQQVNYETFIKNFDFSQKVDKICPFYFKKPNITLPS